VTNFTVYKHDPADIFVWQREVGPPETGAMQQLRDLASLPFIHRHVAAMPDVHWGMGATIGSVFATDGAVVPAGVGVDIGCGMTAARLPLTSANLPDNADALHDAIDAAVPNGRTDHGGKNDKGAWAYRREPAHVSNRWRQDLQPGFARVCLDQPSVEKSNNLRHLGTLGTGNHFIELCLDLEDRVWILLHSGSRGVGNKIASIYMKKAKQLCRMFHADLPHPDLAFIPDGVAEFDMYLDAVQWAQSFARVNREVMLQATIKAVHSILGPFHLEPRETIACHHNYIAKENHFGKYVWVTRKGAVRARKGDMGIIPGSMGTRSYIVEGLGNPMSFHSCSHGAGRRMSRRKARESISLEQHREATEGVACRKGEEVLDESPAAYKSIDAVMASQTDLVRPIHELKQFVCVKGA